MWGLLYLSSPELVSFPYHQGAEIKQNSHMLPVFTQFPEPAGHWLHLGGCRQWWACGQSAWQDALLAPRRLQFFAFQFSRVVKYFDFSNLPE